jgi:hypothetical protein
MCFTCITGETDPSNDYEIAEACDKFRFYRDYTIDRRGFLDPPEEILLESQSSRDSSSAGEFGSSRVRDMTDDDLPF